MCTKDGSNPFCQLPRERERSRRAEAAHPKWPAMPFVQRPYKKHTSLIYFVSCSFDYLAHSKECKEIRQMTFCKSEGDSLQE